MFGWIKSLFTGDTVKAVAQVADEAYFSGEEKAGADRAETNDARAFAGTSHNTWFDALVDGINRLIRPGITIWLVLGISGRITLPDPGRVDPFWLQAFLIVLTFWFGGRVLLKDLPIAIAKVMELRALLRAKR